MPATVRILTLPLAALLLGGGCEASHPLDVLGKRLASASVATRRAAIAELEAMGTLSNENLALAERALIDDDAQVRRAAARVLIAQAAERPELAGRLIDWAAAASDPHCRELLENAAVGKFPASADE